MSGKKADLWKLIGIPLFSAAITYNLLIVAANVVSVMSRATRGENASLSWADCVLSSVAVTIFMPWLGFRRSLKQPGMSAYLLVCLAAATLAWYFTGFDSLLWKAYRRGL